MFAAETFGVTPDVLCIGQGDERRLRPALGDDLPPADRRRLLGADRREPRLRRGAHLRGQPDLVRRRASPCCARSSSATCCGNARAQGERLRAGFERLAREVRRHRRHPRQGAVPGDRVRPRPRRRRSAFPAAMAFGVQVGRRALANGLLCRFDPHWIAFGPPLIVDGRADRRDGGDPRPQPRARSWTSSRPARSGREPTPGALRSPADRPLAPGDRHGRRPAVEVAARRPSGGP